MSTLNIDDIARDFFKKYVYEEKEEKEASMNKTEYQTEKPDTFYNQFREEFNRMYIKTLVNLRISRRKNPTLAALVKDDLLKVLSEGIGDITINPSTHKLDFSNFRAETLKKTRHRIKKIHFRTEIDAAEKDPEIADVSSSSEKSKYTEETTNKTADKANSSFDKLLNQYHYLSTSKEKLEFISENMIYDSENLSDDAKGILTKQIAEYLDYKEFVKGIRETNPDILREELRNMYLKKHPELDKEEFYDKVNFTKSYLNLKRAKEEYDELSESNTEIENLEKELLLEEIAIYSESVSYFTEKYDLSEEIANKLCENLNDGEPTIDEDQEFFVNVYATLDQLHEDYEIKPSSELQQKIAKYEKLVDDLDKENLSEEEIRLLVEIYQDKPVDMEEIPTQVEDEKASHISQIIDDKGDVAKKISESLEEVDEEQQNSTIEIEENPIAKFFNNLRNKFTQKSLPVGSSDLNLENTKQSVFSKIKNAFSRLSDVNQSKASVVENDTIQTANNPNTWGALPQEQRITLQIEARKLALDSQNKPKEPPTKTDNTLQIG